MKTTLSIILVAIVIISGLIFFSEKSLNSKNPNSKTANNVSLVEGKQIVTITAKGGYLPKISSAKADIPTILKIDTKGTFDCSTSLRIPSLGYFKNLPPSGETLIDIPPQKTGTSLKGICSMGMYNFSVNFN